MITEKKRPLPILIVGIAGWLFLPLGLWLVYKKTLALVQGAYAYTLWAAVGDLLIMLMYVACIFGLWMMKRWTPWVLIIATCAMVLGQYYFGVFNPRDLVVPLVVLLICLFYFKTLS